jgi:hypothetical protein
MELSARWLAVVGVMVLSCTIVLGERLCSRCNARAESDRWVYCPFCGTRYEGVAPGPDAVSGSDRDKYERVTWEKIRLDIEKFNHRYVCFEVRYLGIGSHFAPVEILGITSRDYVNFRFVGNATNYAKQSPPKLVERLRRLTPYAMITVYARIKVVKNPGGQDVIVVLADDVDA